MMALLGIDYEGSIHCTWIFHSQVFREQFNIDITLMMLRLKILIYNVYLFINVFISFKTMQILMRALSSPPFANYRGWWSLADSKYAGTALFVKKCFQPKNVFFNLDKSGINLLWDEL